MSSESGRHTALGAITASYTDSEGDPDSDAEFEHDEPKRKNEPPEDQEQINSVESSVSSMDERRFTQERNLLSSLVSYSEENIDDTTRDSPNHHHSSDEDMQYDSSDSQDAEISENPPLSPMTYHRSLFNLKKHEIRLPPICTGRCSKSVQEKITELCEKRKNGTNMNTFINANKNFRNPSIYEKLITFCNIDERGTNYPPEIYDPHCWGPESFYEELAKRQKEEMDKREKEKKERTKVEFISGTAKKPPPELADPAKRKSKWDIGMNQMTAAPLKPATLVTPTVLPVATGTKPTVISAFGTITKKSK